MTKLLPQLSRISFVVSVGLVLTGSTIRGSGAELLPPGFRPLPLGVHALVGARVVPRPGEEIENATIVIRDGLIRAVGKEVSVPADARVWDVKGTTIYAGFIDPYLVLGATNPPVTTSDTEPISAATVAAAGIRFFGVPGAETDPGNPGPGYELARVTPEHHAVQDYSPKDRTLEPLREQGFTTGVIAPAKGIFRGTSALVELVEENPNVVVLKPDVFQHIAFETRGEDRSYPGSLMGVVAVIRQSFFDAQHYGLDRADYEKHPADRMRPDFNPANEALVAALEKKVRIVFEPGSALMIDRAARIANELGIDFCLVSCGQEWRRPDLAKATGASFIVPLNFPELPRLPAESDWEQVSLDQLRTWDWAAENPALLRQQGLEIALTTYGLSDKKRFRQNLRLALDRGLSESDALAALTTVPARWCGAADRLGTIEPGKLANLTVVDGKSYFDADAKVREVWIDGRIYRGPVEEGKAAGGAPDENRSKKTEESAAKPDADKEGAKKPAPDQAKPGEEKKDKKKEQRELQKTRVAHAPTEGRGPLVEPKAVLVQNATVWTCATEGRLENADVLIAGGKIQAVGKNLTANAPEAPLTIDGHGLHVTPGLLDCHNHSMILGSVNEFTLPSTAMVRIQDVVNSESDNIRYQLAGGVTAANLLHGSANPIGGQNCVIKLRDGASPEQLIFEAAPPGIKFALGENVKQSAATERTSRFPQSRMGVRSFIANRFTAAREYLAEREKCKSAGTIPPRRNLELEALGEILQGQRWIHCHSYRQDEILMLIHLMDEFGVKVATFQHVLEGYKVADEIAKHGAGASTFSDWWAYKFEVYDAIPYNGALMHDRGVVVSFNSDSSDLARRLYTEAAKAVKYGGISETEALKFVTLNPARQLRVDKHVGSLETGKDADFAIWSRSPLDSQTLCLQTWIDGKKYFDRAQAETHAASLAKEREDLLAKAKKLARLGGGGRDTPSPEATQAFFRVSLEHEFDGRDRDCLDE